MEELKRAEDRLDNIRGVKPIIGGLRTISLGSWQAAVNRQETVRGYAERLEEMLPAVLPHLPEPSRVARQTQVLSSWVSRWPPGRRKDEEAVPAQRVAALVIGSERGLCGRFNAAVAEHTKQYLDAQAAHIEVRVMALGSRLQRVFHRREQPLAWSERLSVTSLPPYARAFDWTQEWLASYEDETLDALDVIHNAYRGTGDYEPTVTRLIPPPLPEPTSAEEAGTPWPPPIIETDPLRLYATIVAQWTAVKLYSLLLDSTAAEHSTRYQLLESATQNIDQMIEDLTLVIQTARQHEITQEMQELAVGAGLLDDE